jgi:TIR domain
MQPDSTPGQPDQTPDGPRAPSAFVSYAHDDEQFVIALIKHLLDQGLDVRYDRVALHIGESLTRAIAREVTNGDFLIAVVSPNSVQSEWCQTEVALAMNQGINQRRPKVLPVRFGGVEMPPMLQDTVWVDANLDNQETVARRLAAEMRAHLEGRDADARRDAEQVEPAAGPPAHMEVVGDVTVAQIDEVAHRAIDVFTAADRVWRGRGNVYDDLPEPQRRLHWAFGNLPERVRDALPLIEQLATSEWDDFFGDRELLTEHERDVDGELRAVRTQVAQGLPVTRRWVIDGYVGTAPVTRDAVNHGWRISRGDEQPRLVEVYISRTALMSDNQHLPREVALAKDTDGRSAVEMFLSADEPPPELSVTTSGISDRLP